MSVQSTNTTLQSILHWLTEMQAIDVKVINVAKQTAVTDYMIMCSGRSSRHVKAIGTEVMTKMKEQGLPAQGNHGLEQGDWVLIDFGECVLHVMVPDSRAFYNLESLWEE